MHAAKTANGGQSPPPILRDVKVRRHHALLFVNCDAVDIAKKCQSRLTFTIKVICFSIQVMGLVANALAQRKKVRRSSKVGIFEKSNFGQIWPPAARR